MDEFTRRVQYLEEQVNRLQTQLTTSNADDEIRARQLQYQLSTLGVENFKDSITTDMKFYKNLCYNSSFERAGTGAAAAFWDGGTASTDASWDGSSSLKLLPGQVTIQTVTAQVDPTWYGRKRTWVALVRKFGALRVEVYSNTLVRLAQHDFPYCADWPAGKIRFLFEPGNVTRFYLRIANIDPTQDAYIDAVQIEPDWNSKWPSIYSDGPSSSPLASSFKGEIHVPLLMDGSGYVVTNGTDISVLGALYQWAPGRWSTGIEWRFESIAKQDTVSPNPIVVKLVVLSTGAALATHTTSAGVISIFSTVVSMPATGTTLGIKVSNASTTNNGTLWLARLVGTVL